jgi:hypothetical protein
MITKMEKVIRIVFIISLIYCFDCFAQNTIEDSTMVQKSTNLEVNENQTLKIKDIDLMNKADIVTIESLNKITAKSYRYNVKINNTINFERLMIQPLACWKSSPDQVSENKALLKIVETSVNGSKKQIFYGWMFSSSPSISSMEHPMYDIRVVDCIVDK